MADSSSSMLGKSLGLWLERHGVITPSKGQGASGGSKEGMPKTTAVKRSNSMAAAAQGAQGDGHAGLMVLHAAVQQLLLVWQQQQVQQMQQQQQQQQQQQEQGSTSMLASMVPPGVIPALPGVPIASPISPARAAAVLPGSPAMLPGNSATAPGAPGTPGMHAMLLDRSAVLQGTPSPASLQPNHTLQSLAAAVPNTDPQSLPVLLPGVPVPSPATPGTVAFPDTPLPTSQPMSPMTPLPGVPVLSSAPAVAVTLPGTPMPALPHMQPVPGALSPLLSLPQQLLSSLPPDVMSALAALPQEVLAALVQLLQAQLPNGSLTQAQLPALSPLSPLPGLPASGQLLPAASQLSWGPSSPPCPLPPLALLSQLSGLLSPAPGLAPQLPGFRALGPLSGLLPPLPAQLQGMSGVAVRPPRQRRARILRDGELTLIKHGEDEKMLWMQRVHGFIGRTRWVAGECAEVGCGDGVLCVHFAVVFRQTGGCEAPSAAACAHSEGWGADADQAWGG